MKVNELIATLKTLCNPDDVVQVWVDGERYAVHSIDAWDNNHVDINITYEEKGESK